MPVKECFNSRPNKLASENYGKQAESKSFFIPDPLYRLST